MLSIQRNYSGMSDTIKNCKNYLEYICSVCYLAGNFQTAPTIFSYFQDGFFLNDFIKNPKTRNAHAFLPLSISALDSVPYDIEQDT